MKSSWCESFIQYTRACSPVPFAYRDRWEIAGQLFSDGSVRMYCSKNGGTIQSAGQSAGLAFASSWLDPKLVIGVGAPRVWYRKLIIAGSVFTMPEMRAV